MVWFACLLMIALVAGLLAACAVDHRAGIWGLKPAAALVFVATGWLRGPDELWELMLFAGLVLGALGDVLLIPKRKDTFLLGLLAFLSGHLAYVLAFLWRGVLFEPVVIAAVLLAPVVFGVDRWLRPHVEEAMKLPVKVYARVIAAMVAAAVGTWAFHGDVRLPLGAALFLVSDLAVARDRFVVPGFENQLWGLPLYFGSQLLLASCIG